MENEQLLKKSIQALKEENEAGRREAAIALGKIGDERAIEPLIWALIDEELEQVRKRIISVLAEIGESAIEPLSEAAWSEILNIRTGALDALVEIGEPAIEPLIQMLSELSNRQYRVYELEDQIEDIGRIIRTLVRIGEPALKSLIQVYEDGWDEERAEVVKALGAIGGKRVIELLIKALKDGYWRVRKNATLALDVLGWKTKNDKDKALYLIGKDPWDWDEMMKIAEPVAEGLIQDLYECEEEGTDETVFFALIKMGEPAVKPLIKALKDENKSFRDFIAEILGEIGDTRAVEPLIEALKDENDRVRIVAIEALGKIGDPRAIEPLKKTLKDENVNVREAAKKALEKIEEEKNPKKT